MIPSTSVVLPIDREIPKEAAVKEKEPVREEDEVQSDERPVAEKFTSYLSRLQGAEPVIDGSVNNGAEIPQQTPIAQKSDPKGTLPSADIDPGVEFSMGPALLDQNQTKLVQPTVVAADIVAADPVALAAASQVNETVPTIATDPALQTLATTGAVPVQQSIQATQVPQQNLSLDGDRAPALAAAVNGTAGGNANGGALAGQGKGSADTGSQSGNGGNLAAQNMTPDSSSKGGSDSMVARQADMSFHALMSSGRDTPAPAMSFGQSAGGMDGGTTLTGAVNTNVADPTATTISDGARPTGAASPFQSASLPHRGAAPATEQVAVQVSKAVKDGQGEIRIRLNPEELGRVDVKMEVGEDGRILAVLKAERPETLDILRRDVAGLEKALQDAGLDVGADSFTFDESEDGQAYAGFDDDAGHGTDGRDTTEEGADPSAELASSIPPEIAAAALGEYRAIGVNVTV